MASEYTFLSVFSVTAVQPDESQWRRNCDRFRGAGRTFPMAVRPFRDTATWSHCDLPDSVRRVVVTNQFWHARISATSSALVALNGGLVDSEQSRFIRNTVGLAPFIYDDSGQGDIIGSLPSDGPGSLNGFVANKATVCGCCTRRTIRGRNRLRGEFQLDD